MSWPAQNDGPLAVSTTARTVLSAAMSVKAADNASSSASERLLRACGRLSAKTAIDPSRSRNSTGAARPVRSAVLASIIGILNPSGTTCKAGNSGGLQVFMLHGKASDAFNARKINPASLVAAGDPRERCAHARKGCVRRTHAACDRPVAEALGRPQPAAQIGTLSLGDVDAGFLYQPGRQGTFERT